jgi:hypothetical protein
MSNDQERTAEPSTVRPDEDLIELGTMSGETKGGPGNRAYDGGFGFFF